MALVLLSAFKSKQIIIYFWSSIIFWSVFNFLPISRKWVSVFFFLFLLRLLLSLSLLLSMHKYCQNCKWNETIAKLIRTTKLDEQLLLFRKKKWIECELIVYQIQANKACVYSNVIQWTKIYLQRKEMRKKNANLKSTTKRIDVKLIVSVIQWRNPIIWTISIVGFFFCANGKWNFNVRIDSKLNKIYRMI